MPPDHWLVTSQLDVNSFVEAAVIEEQSLSSSGHPKQASAQIHQRAAITPRLAILNNIPFSIPFAVRVTIFRHFVVNDMRERGSLSSYGGWSSRFDPFMRGSRGARKAKVQVRRGTVAQDGFDRLAELDLKAPLEIVFIDQFGQEE
jgi:ubiquitin-protein ligase E3 C